MKGKEILEEEKFFTVTGVIFTKTSYRITKDEIRVLKNKYWENGYFEYKDKLQKYAFTREKIADLSYHHVLFINLYETSIKIRYVKY